MNWEDLYQEYLATGKLCHQQSRRAALKGEGGNPEAQQKVIWYSTNLPRLKGPVTFDLPLNGRWSDLTAEFVFFDNDDPTEGYPLCLEEVESWEQYQRDLEAAEQGQPST